MVKALTAARAAARQALESAYDGVCTVTEYRQAKDAKNKFRKPEEIPVLENQPCRLSFEKTAAAGQTETVAIAAQGIKLFLPPDVEIKPGSKITVSQNGMTGVYSASGVPAVYATHQEIMLGLFKERA